MRFANNSEVRCELAHIRAYDYLPYHLRSKGYEIGRRPMNNQMHLSAVYSVTPLVGLFVSLFPISSEIGLGCLVYLAFAFTNFLIF